MREKNTFTIFGGTGDLTFRKLLPALYNMEMTGSNPFDTQIVIIGRRVIPAQPIGNWPGTGWKNSQGFISGKMCTSEWLIGLCITAWISRKKKPMENSMIFTMK